MRVLCFALVASLFGTACVDPDSVDLRSHGIPILHGEDDFSQEHMAVIAIVSQQMMCTATLITEDVVMTAGHCMEGQMANDFTVLFGSNLYNATRRYVVDYLVHPEYSYISRDIALMRLSSPAPADVSPIPYLPKSLGITDQDLGTSIEFVGFGQTEDGYGSTKKTVTNALDWICTTDPGCAFGDNTWASPNTLCQDQDPGGPCQGDSGGPAFIVRDGKEYVAGVTSYGDQNCEQFGCSTKVDEYEKFILGYINGESGSVCTSDSQCAAGYCVEGICCDSACEGACRSCTLDGQWGTCVSLPDAISCADANVCNGEETCQQGECLADQPLDCANDNPCTTEACHPENGCLFSPVANGTSCSNEDVCAGQDTCQDGACVPGFATECDDIDDIDDGGCASNPTSANSASGFVLLLGLWGRAIWRRKRQAI